VRNPWAEDTYNGTWKDSSSLWTTETENYISHVNADDGDFWMPLSEFVASFYLMEVGAWEDNYINNYIEMTNTVNTTYNFTFTLDTAASRIFLGFEHYNARMYPRGCKMLSTNYTFQLWNGTIKMKNMWMTTDSPMWMFYNTLPAGTYKLTLQPYWQPVQVPDFTIRIFADKVISFSNVNSGVLSSYNKVIMDNVDVEDSSFSLV